MNPQKKSWENLARQVIKGLERRNMEGHYYVTKEEAVQSIIEMIPEESVIAWGGSESLCEAGMFEALTARKDLELIDRDRVNSPEEKYAVQLRSFGADYYLMSSNAVTRDGVLINVDGTGNRAACLIYGPKNVIMLVGMNKITDDVEAGISRLRNVAAPPNAVRLAQKTPCAEAGHCMDCHAKDCICGDFVITRHCREAKRIKVFLVGETLGY